MFSAASPCEVRLSGENWDAELYLSLIDDIIVYMFSFLRRCYRLRITFLGGYFVVHVYSVAAGDEDSLSL